MCCVHCGRAGHDILNNLIFTFIILLVIFAVGVVPVRMYPSLSTVACLPVPPPLRFFPIILLVGAEDCIVVLVDVVGRYGGRVWHPLLWLSLFFIFLLRLVVSVLWCLDGFQVDVFLPLGVCLVYSLALVVDFVVV